MDFLLPGNFWPAAAKGMSVHLRHCPQESGVALTQLLPSPMCPPPPGSGGDRGSRQCGCPGEDCSRSSVLSRSSGRAVPSQRQGEERGPGRTEAFYWGAAKPLRRFDPLPRAACPGFRPRFCPSEIRGAHSASADGPVLVLVILLPIRVGPSVCVE